MSIFSQFLKRSSPQQGIVLYYIVAIVIAFLLLNLPYVHKPGVEVNPIDTLFVAVSGISVTGLSPISIVDTYSTFGQLIILVILNIGGIGVMAIGTMLWVVLGITGKSLIPYAHDYFVQAIVIFLIILGSIGFPVLLEVKAYIQNRVTNFRFSLFTKITTSTYLFLFIVGVLAILLFEHNHAFKGLSWHQSLFYSLFQSATTRSAGLQTIDVTTLSDPTNIIMGILMFIGSSPSSVGGGIRTTTFAILILFLINFSNNADKTSIKVYNREVHIMDIQRSFAVFTMATILTFLGMLIISATENGKLTFLQVFFEVMSAFGTCGLSLGVTSDISDISKVVLMVLMFIGRVGLISFIIMIAGRREPDKFHYPKEHIQIG